MSFEIKTMISTYKPIYDVNDKYLPYGNYNFIINKLTGNNSAVGTILVNGENESYEFKYHSIIKMMARSQAVLCRKANVFDDNIPTYKSPKITPDNKKVHNLSLSIPRKFTLPTFHLPNIKHCSSPLFDDKKIICSICLDPIKYINKKKLHCNHTFHKFCISDWMKCNNTCPICRDIIKLN